MLYKVNVRFSGTAALDLEANSIEEVRTIASELSVVDIARTGKVDILSFDIAAKEITPAAALGGSHTVDEDEDGPRKPRPSGWYRPPA